jgi:DNA-binding beta-propeller fold protein YncE
LLILSCRGSAEPVLTRTDLFEAGKNGYALYRIPGVVVTARGTVLVYCEARKKTGGDWDAIDILLRRSTDGGVTWEAAHKIVSVNGRVAKNPVALKQKLGKEGDVTTNNPVAIVDRQTGAVHFLYCVEYGRCFCMHSDNDGKTFTKPVEITPAFEEFRRDYDWKVLATGPGHGIQLKNGRLVVPVWLSTGTGGGAHRPSCMSVITSDDHGKTWKRGDIVARDPALKNPNETIVVQLHDGRVMLNTRHEDTPHLRAVFVSGDGATGWSKPRFDKQLPEPICMASIVRLTELPAHKKNRILFANPHNPTGRERKNLTIKLSYDEGATWPLARTLEAGTSGYSDLAVAGDGTIFCFYERGSTGSSHFHTRALCLARLNLEWLTNGKDRVQQRFPDYRVVRGWPTLPKNLMLGPVSAVATDSTGLVYVYHRGPRPILVFDRAGKLLRSWGDDLIKTPHGLRVDGHDNVWVTDIGYHLVMKFDRRGKRLLTLGQKGKPGAAADHFDRPTDVAVTPAGDFYVADGYGNSRIVKFSKDGKYLKEWGRRGVRPGEFNIPHAICLDAKGNVYVADRENKRVQVFDGDGKFLAQWKEAGAPYGLFITGDGRAFVADGLAEWIKVLTLNGEPLGRFGMKGTAPGQFGLPHMVHVDKDGAVYVAEITAGAEACAEVKTSCQIQPASLPTAEVVGRTFIRMHLPWKTGLMKRQIGRDAKWQVSRRAFPPSLPKAELTTSGVVLLSSDFAIFSAPRGVNQRPFRHRLYALAK